jgi:hypothetical protein
MDFKMFLSLMVHRRSKNAAFGQQKGQIHMSGFTPASCDSIEYHIGQGGRGCYFALHIT